MPNFTRSAALAKRLIEASGRTVELLKLNRDPLNSAAPWRGPDMTAEPASADGGDSVEAIACFVPARGAGFGRDAFDREASTVRDAQQVALIASTSLPANTDLSRFDVIRDGTDVWKIVFVGELRPASTSVVWEVAVTK